MPYYQYYQGTCQSCNQYSVGPTDLGSFGTAIQNHHDGTNGFVQCTAVPPAQSFSQITTIQWVN